MVVARPNPSKEIPEPPVYRMRIFAPNAVVAKSRFWYFMRSQHKLSKRAGEIVSFNEIFENSSGAVKNYGIVIRYQSRTSYHNIYKEYRDTSLCSAVGQMYMEMAGRHRTKPETIFVIRTCIVDNQSDLRRENSKLFNKAGVKFPLINKKVIAPIAKYKRVFYPKRPNLYHR